MKVEITCCMCSSTYESHIPDNGWKTRYDAVATEDGFCPGHSKIAEWCNDQCAGCVGGWMDCSLWKDFAYDNSPGLAEKDYQSIESGICPRRVNGTFSFSRETGIEQIDLSDRAESESGKALAQAIREYWEKYHSDAVGQ